MPIDHLAHVRSESARFAEVMRQTDPAARVPTCPDWDAADLVWHLGNVHFFWGTIVRERLDSEDAVVHLGRPAGYAGLLAYFDESSAALIDALAATEDDVPVYTWSLDNTVGFVRRRMAQETLIHRLDAELTAGVRSPLDPALSADGVLEAFEHFFDGNAPWITRVVDGPVGRLTATDSGDAWTVQLSRSSGTHPGSGKVYTDTPGVELLGAGEASFTVTGTAEDLVSWLWKRPTVGDVTVEGDASGLRAVIEPGID